MLRTVLALILLSAILAGCVSEGLGPAAVVASGVPTDGDPTAAADRALGEAINAFGFDLLGTSVAGEGNTVVSPLSAHAALTMTYNGATGDTAEQMKQVLRLAGVQDANGSYADMLASLAALSGESSTTLNIENSIWTDDSFKLLKTFSEADQRYFGAQLESLDLEADGSRDRINDWVAERTNGKITDLVDEIPQEAVIYLVNAVYLDAVWAVPFDPAQTQDLSFNVTAQEQADVPMMSRGDDFMYSDPAGIQAVRLPYEDGRLAMWVILPPVTNGDPRDAAVREIERLADGAWTEIVSQATQRPGTLAMPTFTSRTKAELGEALKAMGMPIAFEVGASDFSDMSPSGSDMFLSRVLHQTYIDVDEEGTEAAAATAVEGVLGAAIEPPPVEEPFNMVVDRPFLFVIEDANSGALLFAGLIADPR